MNKLAIILLLTLSFLGGCQQKNQTANRLLNQEDSVKILQTVLAYTPLNSLMSEFREDTLYVFDKRTANHVTRLQWQGKPVLVAKSSLYVPLSKHSPNFRFYATFPMMKLANDTVKASVVFNDIGDTGLFHLVMINSQWKIIKHEFGKI